MSKRDLKSNILQNVVYSAKVAATGEVVSEAFDIAGFDSGVMFGLMVNNYVDGDYTIFDILESDESTGTYTKLTADQYIRDTNSALVVQANSDGVIPTLGCFSTKRYLKVTINATSVTTGADIIVLASAMGNDLPVTE